MPKTRKESCPTKSLHDFPVIIVKTVLYAEFILRFLSYSSNTLYQIRILKLVTIIFLHLKDGLPLNGISPCLPLRARRNRLARARQGPGERTLLHEGQRGRLMSPLDTCPFPASSLVWQRRAQLKPQKEPECTHLTCLSALWSR